MQQDGERYPSLLALDPEEISSAPATVDGPFEWSEAKPAEAGIDEAKLQKIDEAVATKHKTLSVLIVKDGRLVYERYYQNKGQDDPTGVFSVTKASLRRLSASPSTKVTSRAWTRSCRSCCPTCSPMWTMIAKTNYR